MDKELRKIAKALREAGYSVKPTRKGHLAVYTDTGEHVTTFAGTTGDRRSWLNALAPLKRRGFRWPPTG